MAELTHRRFEDFGLEGADTIRIGLVSDTHKLLRDEACAALAGVDVILHAGDIGAMEVIEGLQAIAPTYTIRGNIDRAAWAADIPDRASIRVGTVDVFMIHDVKTLSFDPAAKGYSVVMSGHSHSPRISHDNGVLYVNPGSIGPRRFKLPIAMAMMTVDGSGQPSAELIQLDVTNQKK